MNKLIFSSALKQKFANTFIQIVSIDELYKELCLAYNLNTSSLKMPL